MTSCGQSTGTREHLVHGAVVNASLGLLTVLLGDQPDERELSVELLGVRLIHEMRLVIPAGTFHVHAIDETAILRGFCDGAWRGIITDLEVIAELINGDLHFSRIVLQCTSEESLREEESRDPERGRGTVFNPFVKECDSFVQVINPRS